MFDFGNIKVGHVLLFQKDGARYLATVASIATVVLDGVPVVVAVTRGAIQFRLDAGIALPPVNAWIVRRLLPSEVRRARAVWAYNERDL